MTVPNSESQTEQPPEVTTDGTPTRDGPTLGVGNPRLNRDQPEEGRGGCQVPDSQRVPIQG